MENHYFRPDYQTGYGDNVPLSCTTCGEGELSHSQKKKTGFEKSKAKIIVKNIQSAWWSEGSCDTFVEAAETLLAEGWPVKDVEDFLQSLYTATCREYGD